jgi:hypothetical protein
MSQWLFVGSYFNKDRMFLLEEDMTERNKMVGEGHKFS